MNLKSLIAGFDTQPKLASAEPTAPAPTAKTAATESGALTAAIGETLRTLQPAKTAAAAAPDAGPAGEVAKLAAQVLGIDKEADLRHSQVMGRAFADGFLAQLELQKQASANVLDAVKTAGIANVTAEELELVKMARENPEAFLAEVARGARDGAAQQKTAAEVYDTTYDAVVRGIHKSAAEHYVEGYAVADSVLRQLAAQNS